MDILTIFVSAIFVNNILLSQFLGNCPYLGCSREKGVAVGMGMTRHNHPGGGFQQRF